MSYPKHYRVGIEHLMGKEATELVKQKNIFRSIAYEVTQGTRVRYGFN